ncbi:MAG TPA: MarR family transcriptional regulator [Jatrophihabitans sp.]|jgi:DNA-binding MarR family transcriptional regulator|uniref:MarR family winged helix-turn-helix transcriptional regulator n=1 Tax=Jatrophihabitans sp. TaxID=1932789 RepID=UPI002EE30BA8
MPHSTEPDVQTRWLSPDELTAWRAFSRMIAKLQWELESHLQQTAELSFVEYHALAMLSEHARHTMRMSELADLTNASLSRLSHLVKRLEQRELVRREPDPDNGRYTNAILTEKGHATLVAAAPAHVAKVRALVIDALTPAQLRHFGAGAERIIRRIDDASPLSDRPRSR